MKLITKNKKAFFDYAVLDTVEAGIVLTGNEVKSIKSGNISLAGSFANVHDGELFLVNSHVSMYKHSYSKDEGTEKRSRKLLVHKKELNKLVGEVSRKGTTIVPLKVYINAKGKIKIEIGLCKHKKAIGKKQALKEQDIRRETQRELKEVFKYK
ncbi:SsrA-binding protein SmpB [bacterium]|jgi:SsrA-binding protein|nr:SsrA-binding protein SmpB [bacterium]